MAKTFYFLRYLPEKQFFYPCAQAKAIKLLIFVHFMASSETMPKLVEELHLDRSSALLSSFVHLGAKALLYVEMD